MQYQCLAHDFQKDGESLVFFYWSHFYSDNFWLSQDNYFREPNDFTYISANLFPENNNNDTDKFLSILIVVGNFKKTFQIISGPCVTHQKYNPRKTTKIGYGLSFRFRQELKPENGSTFR